ncbi:beta-ketoacyl synthase N-terminal-like domain-containing protein [Paenibacillus solisilvae]|uniref:Beta-ketoacyl synthase N-terminal-like domain-containing protein n=1 Tax=Paenibacillus solisilvae TaxID=2486751 RepID=A0ABW0VU89_9BACL
MKNESVITGYGIKLPKIQNRHHFEQVLKNGICTHSVVSGLGPNKESMVCGIIEEELEEARDKALRGYPRACLLGIAAAKEAIELAKIKNPQTRVAVIMGTSTSSLPEIEQCSYRYRNGQYKKISALNAGMTNIHSLSSGVANYLGLGSGNLVTTISNGCSSGSDAIFLGKTLLENAIVDLCIVGASETPLCDSAIASFAKQKAIRFNAKIGETGNPFSKNNGSFVISEGAAVIVLEREKQAKQANKEIYGYLTGAASNNDGVNIHQMDKTGAQLFRTFEEAVGDKVITYTNSQALGLDLQDTIEAANHLKLCGTPTPITSIKGMIGHPFAASGVVQVISALLSIKNKYIPLTANSDFSGFELFNIVKETTYCDIQHVAVTSHGYGGNNNTLVVSKEGTR